MDCKKCSVVIKAEDSIKCATCQGCFHYFCAALTETEFRKILPMNKMKWKCYSCKGVKKNLSPIGPNTECSSTHSLINIDANAIMEHIDSRFSALQLAIDSLKTDVNGQLMTLSATVNSWENKITCFASSISTINAQISDLDDENQKLKQELDLLRLNIKDITDSNHRNEQWVRRSNIQINGIPEKKGENLLNLVTSLAQKCDFAINVNSDIDFVTRVAVKNDSENKRPKPIILKMHSRYKKDDFLTSLRKLKKITAGEIGISGAMSSNRIYFNDHLSSKNKYLLRQAQRLAKEKGYAYCWVRNCTIMLRRSDQSPIIHVTSDEHLNKIA